MGGNICCCKGAEPVEEVEQVPEKTNRIMLQYDEADADKLTNFGAKLSTNSEGEHRLVEVKKEGLAKQLHLKNDDVIIELNGADVTDVCHESLLLSLHDLGTQVQFVVNRRNEGTPQQGRVYFRLGPAEGDVGCVEACIAYEKHEFIDESSPCMNVFVNAFVLPTTEAFETLGIYVLDSAQQTTLQITKEKL
ncbi:uncharacterized protein LOC105439374 [Strongylocentrotus purpuratus]|uniref:PDZ domain-containing protein n=1 Tax=Strongylocentrotus purpuratus TaxID=7668 RepID=A0A7M7NLS4_STRPU|nr:uncharacterized protein LOC105439374 [Strongylocentrotus purpuratus]